MFTIAQSKWVMAAFGILPMCAVIGCGTHSRTSPEPAGVPARSSEMAGHSERAIVTDRAGVLSTRPVWPVNVPLYVRVNPSIFQDNDGHVLSLLANAIGAPTIRAQVYPQFANISFGPDLTWDDLTQCAGTFATPRQGVSFSFELSNTKPQESDDRERPQEPLVLPVRVDGQIADLLTPTPIPELDHGIATQLNAQLYRHGWYSRGVPRLWLGTYTNCSGDESAQYPGICHILKKYPDVTWAVHIEVLHDGALMARSSAWWRGAKYGVTPFEGMLALEVVNASFESADPNDEKWMLRFTPAPEFAMRDFESSKYWTGTVTASVKVVDAQNWDELGKAGRK